MFADYILFLQKNIVFFSIRELCIGILVSFLTKITMVSVSSNSKHLFSGLTFLDLSNCSGTIDHILLEMLFTRFLGGFLPLSIFFYLSDHTLSFVPCSTLSSPIFSFNSILLLLIPTALIDFMQLIPIFPLPILTSLLTCLPNFLLHISSWISQGHLNTACLNPNSSSFPSNLVFFPVFPILVNGSTCYTS